MFLENRKSVAVIVTHRNYRHFLPDALSSIQKQLLKPDEVIVVDDKSDENCRDIVEKFGYRYLKTDFGNPLLAREAGFEATQSEFVCFLDADDRIPESYLAHALVTLDSPEIDIAFSDLQHFGLHNKLHTIPIDIPSKRLWQVNFLHVGCVVSRIAVKLSEAFKMHPDRDDYHEDWLFWRKVIGYGFKYAKQQTPYEVRVHDQNRSMKIRDGGYLTERAVNDSFWTEIFHFNEDKKNWKFLHTLNFTAKQTTEDYICIGNANRHHDHPDEDHFWPRLSQHLDHDVAAVHDKRFDLFDCTLFVGPVLRSYLYRDCENLPFDEKTERIVYV